MPTIRRRQEPRAPPTHVGDGNGREFPLGAKELDCPTEALLRALEPTLGELPALGLRQEMNAGEVCECRPSSQPVQRPTAT